jgi:hypothetical protein
VHGLARIQREVQAASALNLSAKAFQCLRVFGNIIGQERQSDKAAQFEVLGFVDHTHPTTAQLPDDAIVRDGLPDHAQGCYGGSEDKSMIGGDLEAFREGDWRSVAITLFDGF